MNDKTRHARLSRMLNPRSIVDLLILSFSVRAGGAFVPYLIGHFWEGATAAGAVAAIVLGSAVVVAVDVGLLPDLGLGSLAIGVVVSALALAGGTLLARRRAAS